MVDELLPYYNRELLFLRKLSGEFAKAHPKIAANLRISGDSVDDPHVARLIEAVALLNARIRYKLDDEFTEVAEALLEILYPHFLAPWPSMGIVEMQPKPDLGSAYKVSRGTEIDIEAASGENCRYRTTADAELWPIKLTAASLQPAPFVAPANPRIDRASSVLKLVFEATGDEFSFNEGRPEKFRLYLRGAPQIAFSLYELLLNNAMLVGVAGGEGGNKDARFLEPAMIKPGGTGPDEAALPSTPAAQKGYRLLSEYFAFPEKFLFVDITGLADAIPKSAGKRLEIYVYLDRTQSDIQRSLSTETFALGCVPIINLFEQSAEPIRLSQATHDYRVIPDARRSNAMEVYAIRGVHALDRDGSKREFLPFYSIRHTRQDVAGYWFASRHADSADTKSREMRISLVDLGFDPQVPADSVLHVKTLCTNGDLPSQIPYGGGNPRLSFVSGAAGVDRLACITPLTSTRRPDWGHGSRWRLISHLTLNHLSLTSSADGTDALREILKLYNVADSAETRSLIDGIDSVRASPGTARYPVDAGAPPWAAAVCRGVDVDVVFDPAKFSGNGIFMMATLLDVFFGLYCTINSFTRLTARVRGQSGILKRWPPRAGEQPLL